VDTEVFSFVPLSRDRTFAFYTSISRDQHRHAKAEGSPYPEEVASCLMTCNQGICFCTVSKRERRVKIDIQGAIIIVSV
jgi:hypothetical protein